MSETGGTMDIGMLWFDNNKQTNLTQKIERAVRYYREKYGRLPDLCYVNPKALDEKEHVDISGIEVRSAGNILPGHFWIGMKSPE